MIGAARQAEGQEDRDRAPRPAGRRASGRAPGPRRGASARRGSRRSSRADPSSGPRSSRIWRKSNSVIRAFSSNAAPRSCSKTSAGRRDSRIAASTAGSVSTAFAASASNRGADSTSRIRDAASTSSVTATVSLPTGALLYGRAGHARGHERRDDAAAHREDRGRRAEDVHSTIAAKARSVSAKLSKSASGLSAASLSGLVIPVATATARTPRARPHATSWIESPTMTTDLPVEAPAGLLERALDRDRRQLVPVGGIAPVGAEREVAVEVGRRELQPGAALEVPGEKAQRHARIGREPLAEGPRCRASARPCPERAGARARRGTVSRARVRPRSKRSRPTLLEHELTHDLGIGLARKVELAAVLVIGRVGPVEGLLERAQDRVPRDPARRNERPVDVEEDEPVPVRSGRHQRGSYLRRSRPRRRGVLSPRSLQTAPCQSRTSCIARFQ